MPKFINHNSLEPFPLEKGSVNIVATSPPYYALRNYGHPDQIGQEPTVQEYVDNLRKVAANVWEVLADTGSYYLNIGDSYAPNKSLSLVPHRVAIAMTDDGWILRNTIIWHKKNPMPCSIKDRLTPTHEYVFHFVKQRKYYYDLDAIRVPHQTLKIQRQVDVEATAAKLGKKIKGYKMQKMFEDVEFIDTKGYEQTKLSSTESVNVGARGGFAKEGERMENRYADGGKNPGDVFHEERVFTREDELRAIREKGYGKAAARITERLHVVQVKGHPLGKNPGDVQASNYGEGSHEERAKEAYWLDGFDAECPSCSSQFKIDVGEIFVENPGDVWSISTVPFKDAHYAVWPPTLVEMMIKAASKVGDIVLDPFSGSGTTAVIAESLSRVGIGFDLSFDDVRERRVKPGISKAFVF